MRVDGGSPNGCRDAGFMILFGFVAFLALLSYALAHDSWISKGGFRNGAGEWCCGDSDCQVVPNEDVGVRFDGYHLTFRLFDGQAYGGETVPFSEAQPSPDGAYWRCKRADQTRRCFFAPPPAT